MRQSLAVLLALFFIVASAVAGPLEKLTAKAQKGNPEDQYTLGVWYFTGWNVERDYKQAADWFAKAAGQGHPAAQRQLGQMYSRGQGFPISPEQSQHWLSEAAHNGDPVAAVIIGWRYKEGSSVPKDLALAYSWFSVAAALGNDEALRVSKISEQFDAAGLAAANEQAAALVEEVKHNRDAWQKRFPPQ